MICPVCCGTKRLTEIRCPSDCSWLVAARAHPPAAILRQRERDARFIVPLVQDLSERSSAVLLLLQDVVRRHRQTAIPPIVDDDLRQAAGALAATFETAAKGIIYEHQPTSLPAQRLLLDLRAAIDEIIKGTGQPGPVERDAAAALKRLEWGAKEASTRLEPTPTAYLDLLNRLPYDEPGGTADAEDEGRARTLDSRIIVP